MLQQIKQVLITYCSHRFALLAAVAVVGLIIAPNLLAAAHRNEAVAGKAQAMTMVLGMPLFFMAPFLVGHVKTQFAHPRARLIPHFYSAHILTLGGLLVALLVLYPLLIAGGTGFAPLGLVALAVAIAAPAIWGVHLSSWLWMIASLGLFYSLLTDWGMKWWIMDAPLHSTAHALTILVGGAMLMAWLWRLCGLREEMDDYRRTTQWQSSRRSGGEAVEQRRIIAQQVQRNKLLSWTNDFWLAGIGMYHDNDQARIVRLLRFGFTAQPVELQALIMAAMFFAVTIFLTRFSYMRGGGPGALWFLVQMSLLMPGVWAGLSLVQRKPRMATELMRPLARSQYFDNLLAASAWNTAVSWLILNTALAIGLLSVLDDQVSVLTAAMFALLSAAVTWATFGVAVRTAIWKSAPNRLAALILGWMALAAPILAWWQLRDKFGDWPFLAVVVVLLGAGGLLINSARRAWAHLEFA